MNKKILATIAIVLVACISTAAVLSMTWTSATITMTLGAATGNGVTIGLFSDCATTLPFTTYDWDGVAQAQTYEVTVYLKNTGVKEVYITYSPDDLVFDGGSTHFTITVDRIEGPGTSCQVFPVTPDPLVVTTATCANGFLLTPGKVIKLDIQLYVVSLTTPPGTWDFDFLINGCAP